MHPSSFPSTHSFDKSRHCFFPKTLQAYLALKHLRPESSTNTNSYIKAVQEMSHSSSEVAGEEKTRLLVCNQATYVGCTTDTVKQQLTYHVFPGKFSWKEGCSFSTSKQFLNCWMILYDYKCLKFKANSKKVIFHFRKSIVLAANNPRLPKPCDDREK